MKKYLPVLIVLLAMISCKGRILNDRIPPKEMAKLLTDLHAAETYSSLVKKDSTAKGFDKNMDSLALYYKEIFAHYNLTQKQFDDNMEWYKTHAEELDTIYLSILPEVSKYEK